MGLLSKLWQDDAGFIVSSELVLLGTVAVLGLTAGMTSVRDQMVQELADVSDAFSEINQSYSFSSITTHSASTAGTFFRDWSDYCEAPGAVSDQNPYNGGHCVVYVPAVPEGTDGPGSAQVIVPQVTSR